MKKLLLLMSLAGIFIIAACSDNSTSTKKNPLVGNWTMDNMQQTALYTAARDYPQIGKMEGDTLGGGTVTWQEFHALGVEATVILNDDESFTLNGKMPVASDTLGNNPIITPLTDTGTWMANDAMSIFTLTGNFYQIPSGQLTVDSKTAPTTITLVSTALDTGLDVVLPLGGGRYMPAKADEQSMTTLGFSK